MKIINGSRTTGKTTALLRYAHKNNCLILCPTKTQVRILLDRAKEMNLEIIEPIQFSQFFREKDRYKDNPKYRDIDIVVDEIDTCLTIYLGREINCATGTLPTIHPQTYILSSKLEDDKYYMGDKDFRECVLGEWVES